MGSKKAEGIHLSKNKKPARRKITKRVKPFAGLEKIFTQKSKRSTTIHGARGSTWLKTQNPLKRRNR
jgi:hypothetical protein